MPWALALRWAAGILTGMGESCRAGGKALLVQKEFTRWELRGGRKDRLSECLPRGWEPRAWLLSEALVAGRELDALCLLSC